MKPEDKNEFRQLVIILFQTYGRPIPPKEVIQVWWNVFEPDAIEDVRQAFSATVIESRHFPVPATVKQYIPDRSGFLDPESAWNAYPKAESEGAWVYQEMLQAGGACQDSIDRRDFIGARKAFIETYQQILSDAKRTGKRPVWFYSGAVGLNRDEADQMQIAKTLAAYERKWITQEKAQQVLLAADQSSANPKILQMANRAIKRLSVTGNGSTETVNLSKNGMGESFSTSLERQI